MLGNIENLEYVSVWESRISPNEHVPVGTALENLKQGRAELFYRDGLLVDAEAVIPIHLHDNRVRLDILRLCYGGRFGDPDRLIMRSQRRRDHEDDQKHEQNIYIGSDVDVRPHSLLTANRHSHLVAPSPAGPPASAVPHSLCRF